MMKPIGTRSVLFLLSPVMVLLRTAGVVRRRELYFRYRKSTFSLRESRSVLARGDLVKLSSRQPSPTE